MVNPVSEMFEMIGVAEQFKAAVENNLVMDFEEYVARFGVDFGGEPKESVHDAPCEPFVYVGEKYGGGVYDPDMVVSGSCVIGHDDIISVWGDISPFGYPRLSVSDDGLDEGWVWLDLEYVDKNASKCEQPVEMAPQAYLNRVTGEFEWCRW